jgi:hypothetical protein
MKCAALCNISSGVDTAVRGCPFRDVSGHCSVRNAMGPTLFATEVELHIGVFVCPLFKCKLQK